MPSADFFCRFGFFVIPDYLGAESCSMLRDQMDKRMDAGRRSEPAVVKEGVLLVDDNARKTDVVEVSEEIGSLVRSRMLELMPILASHFGEPLTECCTLRFYRYNEGDYFKLHRDSGIYEGPAKNEWDRKLTAIVFLNAEDDGSGPDSYEGGQLVFHDLSDDTESGADGFPLQAELGLLVAFPAYVPHEVKPITRGRRYSLVARFR